MPQPPQNRPPSTPVGEGRVGEGRDGIVLDDPHRPRGETELVISVVSVASLCTRELPRELLAGFLPFRAPRRGDNLERPVGQERQQRLSSLLLLPFGAAAGNPREFGDGRREDRRRRAHGRRDGRACQRGDERAAAVHHRGGGGCRDADVPTERVLLHRPVGGEHSQDVGVVFVPSHQRRPLEPSGRHARIPHLALEVPSHVSPRPHLDAVRGVARRRHAERRAVRRPRQRAHSIARAVARKIETSPAKSVTLEEHDSSPRRRRGDERSPRLPRERRRGGLGG